MRYEQEVMAIMDRGKEKWCAQGRAEGQMSTAFNLHRMGMQESFIADAVGVSEAVVRNWFAQGRASGTL